MALNPASIPAILAAGVAAHGNKVVLRKKDHGIWKATTWAQLGEKVRAVGLGLQAIGFRPGDVACVLAETRPEWVHIDLGILGSGGVSGGLNPELEAEALGQALRESHCRVLFVENEEQLDKVLLVRDGCPELQRIVIIDTKGLRDFADTMCDGLRSFVSRGGDGQTWSAGVAAITEEAPAVLLPGTETVLTHGEALRLISDARSLLAVRTGDERVALLPMCHVTERVLGLYLSLAAGVISNYLENPDTVIENLQEVQPTVLAADAGIWRLLYSRINAAAAGATPLHRMLYRWAIAAGGHGGAMASLARLLVLRAVRQDIGLRRLRVTYLGTPPLSSEIEGWVAALGITIQHIDGLATQSVASDARYQSLAEAAFGT